MEKIIKNRGVLLFVLVISFLTFVIFRPVFLENKIPFNANLIASFYNPWAQEKFANWEVGIPNKPVGKDDIWIFYPQRTFTNSVLKNGEIPFWNPYSFSGNYHLGLSETAVFYPLNFLFLIFSQIDTWAFLIIIEPIIAGLGMYLFLKRIVQNLKSAALGALAFAFSGIVIVRSIEGLSVGHSLIWMPYVFWSIESFFQTKKTRFLWLILVFLSLSLLAGWFQYTFYIFVLGFLYAVFKIYFSRTRLGRLQNFLGTRFAASLPFLQKFRKLPTLSSPFDTFDTRDTRGTLLVFFPFLILPLITLFHLIPAYQTLLESPRSALEGGVFSFTHLMPIQHLYTLIFPDIWGNPAVYNYFGKSEYKESIMLIGVIPLLFSLVSIFKKKKKEELFFLGTIIVSFILAIDNPLSRWLVSSDLPVFSSFLPNRIFLISTFSFSVLSAFGLDHILKEKGKNSYKALKRAFVFLWAFVIFLVLFFALEILKDQSALPKTIIIQIRNSVIPVVFIAITTFTFFIFKNKYSKSIFFIAVIVILFLQSYLFSTKFIPFSERQFLYPNRQVFSYLALHQGFDRFMSIGYGHIVPSIPLQFGLYSPEGIGSMYIRRYGELVRYMKLGDMGIADKIAFDQEIYPKDVFPLKNQRLHRFYELTSVKYIVSDKKSMTESGLIPDKDLFRLIWENDKWQIFQYKKSMPRFFVTSDYKVIKNDRQILDSLFGKDFVSNRIILEEDPGFKSKTSSGSAEIIDYSPNRISAKIKSSTDSLFYLSDNYSKMFRVFIDGKEGKVLRANYTFRAVPIPKGEHFVEMKYDDRSFILGLKIAIITISILGIFGFVYGKYI